MDNIGTLLELYPALKPLIIGLINEVLAATGTTAGSAGAVSTHDLSGSAHSGTLGIAYVPDALDRNGSRPLVGNLVVGDGITVDGVDISALDGEFDLLQSLFDAHDAATAVAAHGSVGAHDHTTAGAGGDLTQYATVANLRPAYSADRLNKSTTAGAGLTGGGAHTADIDLAVGAGYGILVGADAISVDQDFDPVWTGDHQFNEEILSSALKPRTGSSFDVGSIDKKYRVGNFEEFRAFVFSELELHPVGGFIIVAKDQGNLGAPVLAADTQIDFGKAMVEDDMVDLRTAGQYERLLVGSLDSGTLYNVTRDLDGSGANDWNLGDVWVAFGQEANDNGWLQMNAYDSPRLQLFKKGSDWDNDMELIRLGDLNGNWGYGASKFGLAIGLYEASKANITLDEDGTLRIRNFTTDVVRLGSDGLFELVGTMKVSGTISAGGDRAFMNTQGFLTSNPLGAAAEAAAYKQTDGTQTIASWGGYETTGLNRSIFESKSITGRSSLMEFIANIPSGQEGTIYSYIRAAGLIKASMLMQFGPAQEPRISFVSNIFNVEGARMKLGGSAFGSGALVTPVLNESYYRQDLRSWHHYEGAAWRQSGAGHFASSFPSSPPSGCRVYREDFRATFVYDGAAWRQTSEGAFTSFPSSPLTDLKVYRTDFRCYFAYDGSAWRQLGSGAFTGAFPSSPVDDLRVYRIDRDIEYFYNSATSQWLSTQLLSAPLSEVRFNAPYTSAQFGASDTAGLIWYIDNRSYAVRIVETHLYYGLGATNTGANYWHYRLNYDNNDGSAITDLIGTAATPINTSALAASATGVTLATTATIAANAKGGRVALFMRTTGGPSAITMRGEVRYRHIG